MRGLHPGSPSQNPQGSGVPHSPGPSMQADCQNVIVFLSFLRNGARRAARILRWSSRSADMVRGKGSDAHWTPTGGPGEAETS